MLDDSFWTSPSGLKVFPACSVFERSVHFSRPEFGVRSSTGVKSMSSVGYWILLSSDWLGRFLYTHAPLQMKSLSRFACYAG